MTALFLVGSPSLVAGLGTSDMPALEPEDDRYVKESEFAATNLKHLDARFVFDGEQFEPVCSCKPPPPEHGKKCHPRKVRIEKLDPFPGVLQAGRLIIDGANLRKLIGDPSDLKIVDAKTHFASDIDGRSSDEVLGVWGGEFGELLLTLSVWEDTNIANVQVGLTNLQITKTVQEYMKLAGANRKFMYIHTDTEALAWIESKLGKGQIDITAPPLDYQAPLLELLKKPEAMGCPHVKQIMLQPDKYEMRLELVHQVIEEFYKIMWDQTSSVRPIIKYYVLHSPLVNGLPNEAAWVNLKVGEMCEEEMYIPLFPPWSNGVSVYINTPQYAEVLHKSAALVVKMQTGGTMDSMDLRDSISEKYKKWDEHTKSLLPQLAGLPVFDVTIDAIEPETDAPAVGEVVDLEKPFAPEMYKVGEGGEKEKPRGF